jgi:UDP-glucose 4-epimerase
MKVFVTGGAGYIGSHTVRSLTGAGHEVLVYDDLSTGNRWAVKGCDLVEAGLEDTEALAGALKAFAPDLVMHFAASIVVSESVREPLGYYRNNVSGTINLLSCMRRTGVGMLVFSSTAVVYSPSAKVPITETEPLGPISPYGMSKIMCERIMEDLAVYDTGFSYVSLRYFNVAGADPAGGLGQAGGDVTHLIPMALKAAMGGIERLEIYGRDYPTPDGTCIRDYVHVSDISKAHLLAMDRLSGGGGSGAFNCGYGRGVSVLEVIDAVRRVTGSDFQAVDAPRRSGDPPVLVADCSRIMNELGFSPEHDDLDHIVATAWAWEKERGGRAI